MEWMDVLGIVLVAGLMLVGMAGAVYPVLPGAIAIYGAFFVYGWFFSFDALGFWFWLVQTVLLAAILIGDYAISALGTKKFGGSRASVIGGVIGLLIGPFVIPVAGLVAGPFLGAIAGECLVKREGKHLLRVGLGALAGFFAGLAMKAVLQLLMIGIFVFVLLR